MDANELREPLVELIRRAACVLPADVERALRRAAESESQGGRARSTLEWMLKNADEAKAHSVPICQDTGALIFYLEHGPDLRPAALGRVVREAVVEATRRSFLRPNAVDSISGKNSGDNTGVGLPVLHFEEVEQSGALRVRLMLKGGGSENCGVQYTLPDRTLGAGRDLAGIKKCILDAALRAQGFGCAPGVLGVGVGGDRATSYLESKEQFFRPLEDCSSDPVLAAMERELPEKINQLDIGPMGFSGRTTVFGVKIGARHRLPACFFVSVSYMCWAYRRWTMELRDGRPEYR